MTIQSYRHRYANAPGDPAYADLERSLVAQPAIGVPAIVLHGLCDGVQPASQSADAARYFSGHYERRLVPDAGHFLSREAPLAVVQAIRMLGER